MELPDNRGNGRDGSKGAKKLQEDLDFFLQSSASTFLQKAEAKIKSLAADVGSERAFDVMYDLLNDVYDEVKKVILPKKMRVTAVGNILMNNSSYQTDIK